MTELNHNKSYIVVHKYLRLLGIRISSKTVKDTINKHPLKDTVRGVSDTFDDFGISNMVVNLNYSQLQEVEMPILAALNFDKDPFCLITTVGAECVEIYSPISKNIKSMPATLFNRYWTGVVIGAEKREDTLRESSLTYHVKQIIGWIERHLLWIIATLFFMLIASKIVLAANFTFIEQLFFGTKAFGVVVSVLVIYKTYFNTNVLKQFCQIGDVVDCNNVLQSKFSKFFDWVGFGDLSLAYFASTLFWVVFLANTPTNVFIIASPLASVFVVVSIVWQGFVARKWCLLCMVINLTIITEVLLSIRSGFDIYNTHYITNWAIFSACFILILLITISIREVLIKTMRADVLDDKNREILSNEYLFNAMLNQSKAIEDCVEYSPMTNNNHDCTHEVLVITNPSCTKCAKIHSELMSFDGTYNIKIVFTHFTNDKIGYDVMVKLISIYLNQGWHKMSEALGNWFDNKTFNDDVEISKHAIQIAEQHKIYCYRIKLSGTPFVAIDNHILPHNLYHIDELKYIL